MEKFKLRKNLIIIDLETTGVDFQRSSIIQLGAIEFHRDGYLLEYGFSEFIKPYTNEWTKEAYQVHQIKYNFLQEKGKSLEKVLRLFEDYVSAFCINDFKEFNLAQWSCGFDTNLLFNAYQKAGRKYPFNRRVYDISSIVRFYLATKGLLTDNKKGQGELSCARALKIRANENSCHDAYYDAWLSGRMLEVIIKGGN